MSSDEYMNLVVEVHHCLHSRTYNLFENGEEEQEQEEEEKKDGSTDLDFLKLYQLHDSMYYAPSDLNP